MKILNTGHKIVTLYVNNLAQNIFFKHLVLFCSIFLGTGHKFFFYYPVQYFTLKK